jgi:hypothetical protein
MHKIQDYVMKWEEVPVQILGLIKEMDESGVYETEEEKRKICADLMHDMFKGLGRGQNRISRQWVYSLFDEKYRQKDYLV